jgi:hypothetical protein
LLNIEKPSQRWNLTKDTGTHTVQPYLFKGWQYQQTAKKAVEQETRRYLRRKYVSQKQLILADMDVLYGKIIDSVKSYA